MEQRPLGSTGTHVSAFALGTANFGASADAETSTATLEAALEAGITFVDTANAYGSEPGQAEEIVGRALEGKRDQVVLASKVASPVGSGPNERGGGFRHIVMQCEASLKRLRTDWLDLYQLHAWDPATPLEETIRALDHLIRQGKVRFVGTSNFAAWQVVQATWVADRRNLASSPVTEQSHYSLLHRTPELELLPMAEAHGIGLLAYSSLSAGILTGKYLDGVPPGTRLASEPAWAAVLDPTALRAVTEQLTALARQAGMTLQQLALSWVASRAGISSVILGPRTVEQLHENLTASTLTVSDELAAQIDTIVPPGTTVTP